ncbi:MAG: histidine phosphatase family protein [Myxococcales bacterium]|nr:MAG: histidine phosphatase family protein [Myxococcales bacterium]
MRILLVRHAEAIGGAAVGSDHDRWLTDQGRRTMTTVGEMLGRLDLRYSRIYTSPLVRAVQTAEILALTQPGFDGPLQVHRALSSNEGTTARALAPIDDAGAEDLIVMVTHMPKIGVLAAHLGRLAHAPAFGTGSACLLSVDEGRGTIQWMLDPQTLELRRF